MGGAWKRVQIFILTEGLKIELFFLRYQVKEAVWCNIFCQSCVHFDMVLRFVIQGCSTLIILVKRTGTPFQILNITLWPTVYQMP